MCVATWGGSCFSCDAFLHHPQCRQGCDRKSDERGAFGSDHAINAARQEDCDMTLKSKTWTILIVAFACFIVGFFVVFRYSVYENYGEIEKWIAADHMQLIQAVLVNEITTLDGIARDWGGRVDATLLSRNSHDYYEKRYLQGGVFAKLRLNMVLILDADGGVVYAGGYDLSGGKRRQLPDEHVEHLAVIAKMEETGDSTSGIIMLPGDIPVLVGWSKMSGGSMSSVGTVVVGRYLISSDARRVASRSGFVLRILESVDLAPPDGSEIVRGGSMGNRNVVVRRIDLGTIAAYAHCLDAVRGVPLMISVSMPRAVFAQGLRTSFVLVVSVMVAGVVCMSAAILMMQKHVLAFIGRSIDSLRMGVDSVAQRGDPTMRVERDGEDEMAQLAGAINDMLVVLERTQKEANERQQQLIRADRMVTLGTLVSGVAHEISNPNNFVMLNAPIMKRVFDNLRPVLDRYYETNGDFNVGRRKYSELRDEIPGLLTDMLEGAERIDRIVSDLKDFARHDADESPTELVCLSTVAASSVKLMAHAISKATDNFREEYAEDLPKVRANSQRLSQVVANLLMNACEALPDSKKGVVISTRYDSDKKVVALQVRDEGIGMPADIIDHVTDPFFTTKRDSKGMGLGLSVSKGIVDSYQGDLVFESVQGQYTLASVILPVADVE